MSSRECSISHHWNKVTEGLPNEGQLVIAYYEGRDYGDCQEASVWVTKYTDDPQWGGFRRDLIEFITKWADLSHIERLIEKAEEEAYNRGRAEVWEEVKTIAENIFFCSICGNFTTKDPCSLCTSTDRNNSILCVVEEPNDLQAIEETGYFNGQYHILMGSINPLEGVGPEKLRIKELL